MNTVFDFLDYKYLYERCVLASIAHAIMVGKYSLLAAEQAWDGRNYSFQNMEGVRGEISFADDYYICVIQNEAEYEKYTENQVSEILHGADENIICLANEEALQYMLVNHNGAVVPFISSAFWGCDNINNSNYSEEALISSSEKMIMPFLYSESDAKAYWKAYYEMSDEQVEMVEAIYKRRISTNGKITLTLDEINKLKEWFGDIEACMESLGELDII